jgi:hypothetical protein
MKSLKFIPVLAMAFLVFACSPALPQKDVDAATAAFAKAKQDQADVYAADAFKAASDANDALTANLAAKDYSNTKTLAQALLDASNKADSDVAAGIDQAKKDVAQLTTDVAAAKTLVSKELTKAERAGRHAKVDVKKAKADFAAATATGDDQADVAAGKFGDARTKLTAEKAALTTLQQTLEAAGYKN